MKLSAAQRRVLREAAIARDASSARPYGDGRHIGRLCCAWDRTVDTLVRAGLMTWSNSCAYITRRGRVAITDTWMEVR